MTAKIQMLSDTDLDWIEVQDLRARYRELRAHVLVIEAAHDKRDRSAILRMAGNIAGGIEANPKYGQIGKTDGLKEVAERAVRLARAIMTEIDVSDSDRSDHHRYLNNLRPGETVVVDGHLYGRCKNCRKIVRMDKVGDLHICVEAA